MGSKFQEDIRKRFRCWLDLVHKMEEQDVPPVIMASAFARLERYAILYLHPFLERSQKEWIEKQVRQGAAFCEKCDNRINPKLSHPPICEYCDAEQDNQYQELKQQMENSGFFDLDIDATLKDLEE